MREEIPGEKKKKRNYTLLPSPEHKYHTQTAMKNYTKPPFIIIHLNIHMCIYTSVKHIYIKTVYILIQLQKQINGQAM